MKVAVFTSMTIGLLVVSVASCSGNTTQPQGTPTSITSELNVPDSAMAEQAKIHKKRLLADLAKLRTQDEKVYRILKDDCRYPSNLYTMPLYAKYTRGSRVWPARIAETRLMPSSPCYGVPVG